MCKLHRVSKVGHPGVKQPIVPSFPNTKMAPEPVVFIETIFQSDVAIPIRNRVNTFPCPQQ